MGGEAWVWLIGLVYAKGKVSLLSQQTGTKIVEEFEIEFVTVISVYCWGLVHV